MYKVFTASILAFALLGCGSESQTSETKVTNGKEIDDSSYPSVMRLINYLSADKTKTFTCTGTFINDSQVLTAGHCVERGLNGNPVYIQDRSDGTKRDIAKAISYVRHPNYNPSNPAGAYDIAIINFPANTAQAVSELATESPKAGERLTIVGFGNNVNTLSGGKMVGSGGGTKRVGTNFVVKTEGGLIHFYGTLSANSQTPAGADVGSGAGDSGGPLFINGKLAGTTSGGTIASDKSGEQFTYSIYVDINSASSQDFLARHVKR